MNIKEVFEKCDDGDYVVDNKNIKWKVVGGELTNIRFNLYNLYTLKQLLDLDFKKFYNVDWSKVEVDTKILVSNDYIRWYRRHFAKYENGEVFAFLNGTTSYTDTSCTEWKYAKLYKEGNDYVSL